MTIHILLPEGFTVQHRSLILTYVRGKETIPGTDWPRLIELSVVDYEVWKEKVLIKQQEAANGDD